VKDSVLAGVVLYFADSILSTGEVYRASTGHPAEVLTTSPVIGSQAGWYQDFIVVTGSN